MIEPKPKPCKGTGLAKGFGCGKITRHRVYGLGKMCCWNKWLLETENGRIYLEKVTLKVTKQRRELNKYKKERKYEKSLPNALKQTQKVFNEYIRKRDKYKPCISSGMLWKSDFDAGHLFSVKQYSALRFHEDNVHGQSIGDNRFKEGNFEDYLINVEKRIGKEKLDELVKLAAASKRTVKKWTLEELKEIRDKYNQKIKDL